MIPTGGSITRRLAVALAASLSVASLACGDAARRTTADVTVDSSAGYPVITSRGRAAEWRAELITSIASDTGDADGFGSVRSVLLDSAGSVYVVDPSYVQLHVFDTTGALRSRWGRNGSGPGEYSMPYSVAWLGGSLALLDPGNSRISILGPEGAWQGQFITQRISGGQAVRLYRAPPDGFWAYAVRPKDDGTSETVFVRYAATGPTDSMVVHRSAAATGQGARCDRPDRAISFFSPPFGPVPMNIPTAQREQVVAVSTEYRITFLDARGDTVRVIERPMDAAPVTDAEWDAELDEWRQFHEDWPTAHCDRDGWDRPATHPPLEAIFVDDEGQLWVEVLTANGRVFDVFGPDGRLRATVVGLPSSGGIDPSVVAGRIAMIPKDADDVQRVEIYRLRR